LIRSDKCMNATLFHLEINISTEKAFNFFGAILNGYFVRSISLIILHETIQWLFMLKSIQLKCIISFFLCNSPTSNSILCTFRNQLNNWKKSSPLQVESQLCLRYARKGSPLPITYFLRLWLSITLVFSQISLNYPHHWVFLLSCGQFQF
jgi:hypothetical protein